EHPELLPRCHGPLVVSVEDAVAIEKPVEGCRRPDAPLGLSGAETWFEDIRVGGVQLQPQFTERVISPALGRLYPAEIEDAHSFVAVAANAELVEGAFRTEIKIVEHVVVHAERSFEVFVPPGQTGGHRGAADELKWAVRRLPEDHRRLHARIAIDQHHEF